MSFWRTTCPRGTSSQVQYIQIFSKTIFNLQWNSNVMNFWVQVSCSKNDNSWPHTECAVVETIIDMCFRIRHICQTLLWMITTFLNHSKRWREKRFSSHMKRCNRPCMSGCALDQEIFIFIQESMHFVSTGGLSSKIMGDYVDKWCSSTTYLLQYIMKQKFKVFIWLTHLIKYLTANNNNTIFDDFLKQTHINCIGTCQHNSCKNFECIKKMSHCTSMMYFGIIE